MAVPPDAIAVGDKVTIEDKPAPAALTGDSALSFVCVLGLPASWSGRPLRMTVDPGREGAPNWVLFRFAETSSEAIQSSIFTQGRVEGLVSSAGTFGVAQRPAPWSIRTSFDNDPLGSADAPSLLRNISLQGIAAAWWDGHHLFIGDGPRVLIYNGLPASLVARPSVVVGQPSLDQLKPNPSSSTLTSTVSAIWSDGKRLVVASGNRVLVWNAIPTTDFATSDLVLGQQDFVSSGANVGGISAATMSSPQGIDSDGTRLVVADMLNHRVLAWSAFPNSIGQPATTVIGQATFGVGDPTVLYQAFGVHLDRDGVLVAANFTGALHFPSLETNVASDYGPIARGGSDRVRADALSHATSITPLPEGGLAISDPTGLRIGIHRRKPLAATPFDFVLGQPDADRAVTNLPSASSVGNSAKIIAANGLVLVPDHSRLLVWSQPPAFNFDPATFVVGQAGFGVDTAGADYRRIAASTLALPSDVAVNDTLVAIADRGNNRVLLFRRQGGSASIPNAEVVVGQRDLVSYVANRDQTAPAAAGLSGPSGVALTNRHLVVADTENHRVLIWSPIPTAPDTPATVVLGQADFAGRRPNHGNGDADADGFGDADARGMFYPMGVATNGERLFVADRLNHRVLVWDDLAGISSGAPADRVLGQSTFSGTRANRGMGGYQPRIDGFNLPTGVTLEGSSLFVADTENNRVVRWDGALTTPAPAAVIGQPDGTALANPNYFPESSVNVGLPVHPATIAGSVLRPRGAAVVNGRVFVSETDSNRVQIFAPSAGGYTSAGQLGQPTAVSSSPNAGGLGPATMSAPLGLAGANATLFVADAGNHRVLSFPDPSSGGDASAVLGQASFRANGFDRSAALTAGGATRPRGLWISNGELFVAESSRHRVLVHALPLVPGRAPLRIIGQPDGSLSLPNSGGSPTAASLSSPEGVFADEARMVIADTANDRVLIFDRAAAQASIVLGQSSLTAVSTGRDRPVSSSSLFRPQAAFVADGRLFVADTGNHRVLVWNKLPTRNGEPADLVLGQEGLAASQSNRGLETASASSLSLPSAVILVDQHLVVADSGNNRVLVWTAVPGATAAPADIVLGQPDLQSRTASADITSTIRLAGPVALATDGTSLFIADRDANRVLAFDASSLKTSQSASVLFNANSGLVAGPSGLAVERSPLFTSRLFIADATKDRLLVLESISRLR